MASETREIQEKNVTSGPAPDADDVRDDDDKARPDYVPAAGRQGGTGFFSIYKKGQGYWTRMGTAIAAALLGVLTAYNVYNYRAFFGMGGRPGVAMGVAAAMFALFAFFMWRLINKPANAEFLIATDSEMKKVNWTSRKELIGSTKVVILFMFFIAFFLAVIDVLFSGFFQLIGVLHEGTSTIGGG